ncbi:MAG: hypothetical protein M3Y28_03465 [Armatimonadota bacterium]|nr:hypothetical protein [Armatimonadota bacterium]
MNSEIDTAPQADDEAKTAPDVDTATENIGGKDEKGDNEGDNKSTVGTLNTMDPAV